MFKIYLVTNTVNNKVYVGKTSQKLVRRWKHHVSHAPDNDYHFHRAIMKYGPEAFTIQVLDTVRTNEEANGCEESWIALYEATDPRFGYNGTTGGDGVPLTDATKKKLSIAMTGMPRPESARKKLSELCKGAGNH